MYMYVHVRVLTTYMIVHVRHVRVHVHKINTHVYVQDLGILPVCVFRLTVSNSQVRNSNVKVAVGLDGKRGDRMDSSEIQEKLFVLQSLIQQLV